MTGITRIPFEYQPQVLWKNPYHTKIAVPGERELVEVEGVEYTVACYSPEVEVSLLRLEEYPRGRKEILSYSVTKRGPGLFSDLPIFVHQMVIIKFP